MNENELTTKERRAALEANGYEVSHIVDGDNSPYEWWRITAPNGWEYETEWLDHPGSWLKFKPSPDLEKEAIDKAYEHLQREQELAALKRWAMAILDGNEAEYNQVIKDNITADEGEGNE